MPASYSAVKAALKTTLESIDGLHVYDTPPGQIIVPAALVLPGEPLITYDETMARGSDSMQIIVRLLVSQQVVDIAQDNLDPYLAPEGDLSIKATVDGNLGGAVDYARVAQARNYGEYEYAGVTLLGVEFVVEVLS